MLSLEFIRANPDAVRRAGELKGEPAPVDEILDLDQEWRARQHRAEEIKAEQNELSKQFAKTRDEALKARLRQMADAAKSELALADALKSELDDLLLRVPNLFHESVPIGETEAENVVIREWGEKPDLGFVPRTHFDLGESLGIMDFERAVRISGSRFAFLVGDGARLERGLVQFMLDVHTREHGYTELWTPMLVNSAAMVGTANLPKFADQLFKVEDRDLWLIPTAEVPVTNFHREEILDGDQLPLKYVSYAPSWRTEAGAAGKDTRGFIRMHQFSKVELVKVTTAETSLDEFEQLTRDAEDILQRLGLHYQAMAMCTGDMGFAQYKKYDLNAWAPGLDRYLEVSSCSVFSDFQARRANIRYRPSRGAPPRFAHTINGSGLALPRTIDAIMETYQRSDGMIALPDALKPYMGGVELIGAR
ncbi:MAG: serine--tRNA ligase [Chloroflexi bacterium]|nr:MAG: serine--tRNA ligase [Chloroflexota bacterium]TMD74169.1 MAG: serine--tRNA ligase [Chloroflexota bacterium]